MCARACAHTHMMPVRQDVSGCDSFEQWCELRMHVCMWLGELSSFSEDNFFFGKGQKSFRTIWGQNALGIREVRWVEQQEGGCFSPEGSNVNHGP